MVMEGGASVSCLVGEATTSSSSDVADERSATLLLPTQEVERNKEFGG